MLKLDRQEQLRQRYKTIKSGYRPALEVYKAIADNLVEGTTRLLDAGCGEANLVDDYLPIAQQVVGADRYVQPIHKTIEIEQVAEANLTDLPFADQSFDVVMCSWVLEHLEEPMTVFKEISRVLVPGGHFLFITPNTLNYLIWLRRLVPNRVSTSVVDTIYDRGEDYIFQTCYRANTPRTLQRQLTEVGLDQRRLECISDPTYIAINEVMFRLSILWERLMDIVWPGSRVHLVGWYQKR